MPEPILCAHLLQKVDGKLIELLQSVTPGEWDLPTVAPLWKVRDVAAHLLDTALRKLSMVRDGCRVEPVEIRSSGDLKALVNRLNAEGVTVYRRLSQAVLIDLMKLACDQTARFYESLDPFAPAGFGVSWAGEKESLNWFDTARELTERWHHQQQIRLATNRPGIMTPELYYPVLDCFMRGLPFLYRNTITLEECPDESGHGRLESPRHSILVEVSGECGGKWVLAREADGWALSKDIAGEFAAQITIPQELAWRIFTKGVDRACALAHVAIDGDRDLGEKVLDLVAIIG